jgi:type 1 glutamine amidotransferase
MGQAQAEPHAKRHLLVIGEEKGYRHEAVSHAMATIERLGRESGLWDTSIRTDTEALTKKKLEFNAKNLNDFDAVLFYTGGELEMSAEQKAALLSFVHDDGKGFIGIHSATDTFYKWPEYRKLIGGYFNEHPWHQTVRIEVVDPSDPLVSFLGTCLQIADEIYQIRDFDERESHVLLRLDEASVDLTRGNVHPRHYGWPLAWTRAYGQGRVFYTALGHEEAVWRDPRYQRLLLNAILWAIRRSP